MIIKKNQNQMLNNINLNIKSGEMIGIIGESGSGKTTLVDIILGLISPDEGSILYNSKNFKENLNLWRSQIAYLPQESFMINDSIIKNITLGADQENINYPLIDSLLKEIKLSKLIESLPMGINSNIGERGMKLSGGQKQRVAIVRALYFQKNILFLDESTSSLDQETEGKILDYLVSHKRKKTIIIITHKYTSLKYCDKIYEVKNGSLIEKD